MLCGKMALQAGTRLGQYEILAQIGAGVDQSRDSNGATSQACNRDDVSILHSCINSPLWWSLVYTRGSEQAGCRLLLITNHLSLVY